MRKFFIIICAGAFWLTKGEAQTASQVETIVCVRHGEKPPGGLGQLTCRGLNRALALPQVLLAKFGQPKFIFAPAPTIKLDSGVPYYYVRPLMTIEPTAVRCGLPVNTHYDFRDVKDLEKELSQPTYQNATIFVGWEHGLIDVLARDLLSAYGGQPNVVPDWSKKDFDSIYIIKITRGAGKSSVVFSIDHEGLNGLSDDCPTGAGQR